MDHRSTDRPARPQVAQRPVASEPPVEEYASPRAQTRWEQPQQPSRKKLPLIIVVVVAAIVLALAGWWLTSSKSGGLVPATDRYQAVFLDNGQVFFGKLKNTKGEYLVLEGAYYTKKADVPEDATDEQKAAIEANVSLSKVGNEVYGPDTTMSIRSEQVLFWQNLKSDSKVGKAIESAN